MPNMIYGLIMKPSNQLFNCLKCFEFQEIRVHYKTCKQHYRKCNKRNCKPLLFNCFDFHDFQILFLILIYTKSNQNLKPKFRLGSHLYLGAPVSISAKDAGKLVLAGQYLMA